MFTKSFNAWLDQRAYAWSGKFTSKDEIGGFILRHTQRGTNIGKVLNKLKLDFSPEYRCYEEQYWEGQRMKIIQEGVLAFNVQEYIPRVSFTSDPLVIADAYRNIWSCMTDGAEEMGEFLTYDLLVAQGIQLATYTHRDEIVGRCIVNVATQGRCEVYSKIGGQEFTAALTEMGFSPESLTVSHLKYPQGKWIPYLDEIGGQDFIRCRIAGNEEWCFVMPEGGNYSQEAYERIQRIIPGFDGDLEYYDEIESDEWIELKA